MDEKLIPADVLKSPLETRIDKLEEAFARRTSYMDDDLKRVTERVDMFDHMMRDDGRGYLKRLSALERRVDDWRSLQNRIERVEEAPIALHESYQGLEQRIRTLEVMRESNPAAVVAYMVAFFLGGLLVMLINWLM